MHEWNEREKAEKISCLETAMKTDKANAEVQRVSVTGHYNNVVAALKRKYDWPRIVFRHHLK